VNDTPLSTDALAYAPPPPLPPVRSPWWKGMLRLAMWIGGGCGCGAVLGLMLGGEHGVGAAFSAALRVADFRWVALFVVLTIWPQVLIHEAGHALAGLARGMQPLAFGVGPWRWERSLDRWRLRRGGRVLGLLGFAILVPHGQRGLSRLDQCIYLLGGPMANLATFALMLGLAAHPLVTTSTPFAAFVIGTASVAALLGLSNLVPFETQGWRSDGRNIIDLFRRSADAERLRRVRATLALGMAGVRPRDWPAEALPDLPGDDEEPPNLIGLNAISQVFVHALDADDACLARRCARLLAAGHARVPEAMRAHLAVNMAIFAARIERNPDLLAAWRPLCAGGLLDHTALHAWLDAELAELSGDIDAARAALATARALAARVPDAITGVLVDEALDALESRLDARHPAAVDVVGASSVATLPCSGAAKPEHRD